MIADRSVPGLYAPREGQAYRERQRRHTSHFDRGTPGAELELATNTPMRHGPILEFNTASATAYSTPSMAITPTSYLGPAPFGSQPVRPPGPTMRLDPAPYLPRSFQRHNF